MNKTTFNVSSLYNCETIDSYKDQFGHDPVWRQTYLGCLLLQMLQDMYKFKSDNISSTDKRIKDRWSVTKTRMTLTTRAYVHICDMLCQTRAVIPKVVYINPSMTTCKGVFYVNVNTPDALYPYDNDFVDIYVRPMSIMLEYLDYAYPVHAIFQWRFGFLLRYERDRILQTFYSLPFTSRVWSCIIFIMILSSFVFYILSYWEQRMRGGECSYCYELLLAFSAFCQHILPLQAHLYSRRIAYLIFILCSYVVHCFYTSNLLSHLVNDMDKDMDLEALARSDYQFAVIRGMHVIKNNQRIQIPLDKNLSLVEDKLRTIKVMNVSTALEAVRNTKTAVLSDYTSLYSVIKRSFDTETICDLLEVDLFSTVKKYFFTSKQFPFKEEFKIGILRATETGLINRLITFKSQQPFSCNDHETASLDYTIVPVAILLASFLITPIILLAEIVYYKRYDAKEKHHHLSNKSIYTKKNMYTKERFNYYY